MKVVDAHADGSDAITFLSFRIDRRGAQLTRAGETVPLRPKTWAVLLYLAERPGMLVTKEELFDAVWPNVAVTPDTLTKSIGELRLALDDDSKKPRCIETVHRRGFRFIAKPGDQVEVAPLEWSDAAAAARPFVGRGAELRTLEALWAKADAGQRQLVFITGPAGVGKTALVEAFLDSPPISAGTSPVWIGRGSCVEQHGAREPYMPVLDALERLAHRPDAQRLVGLLRRTAPTWLAQMPWALGDDADAVRQSVQAARPERMLREFAALIEALATGATVVLVLEDLHWSDPSTVDLLSVVAQRREPARLLVIGTYRPAEVAVHDHVLSHTVRTLQVHRQCMDLAVHELITEEVQRYLQARFPRADFASTLAPILHDYTDGNPLFLVAVVEHMVSRGWILETGPGWALGTAPDKLQLEVPDDARRVIQIQFGSLSPADRVLVEAASVAGTEFAVPAVAAALACELQDAEAQCEALTRGHAFLRAAESVEWPDASVARRYAFTHELYRHVAYGEIPDGRRQRLHLRIGGALENAYGKGATEIAPELAVHFERGRDPKRALQYLVAAAARARQRFATREAIGYLEAAIAVARRLPAGNERSRRELELRLALAPGLSDLHGFASEPLRDNCERAYMLCAQVGTPAQHFQVLFALCHVYAARADRARTPKLMVELDELAARLATPGYRLLAGSVVARVATHEGRFVETCRLVERRFARQRKQVGTPLPMTYGADPVIAVQCHYALALWMLGDTEGARNVVRAGIAAAQERGLVFTLTAALWFGSLLAVLSRRTAEARDLAEETTLLAAEQGFAHWSAMASAVRGWIRVEDGQLRLGIEEIERACAAHAATGARLFSTWILAFLADARMRAGAFDAGLAAVDEGLALAEASLDRSYGPELWRLKGELLLARRGRCARKVPGRTSDSDSHEAERCLLRALELARQAKARSLELRAATSLARAWHAQRRTADARAVLGDICGWFGANADSPDLTDARRLLDDLATAGYARGGPAKKPRRGRARPRNLSSAA